MLSKYITQFECGLLNYVNVQHMHISATESAIMPDDIKTNFEKKNCIVRVSTCGHILVFTEC